MPSTPLTDETLPHVDETVREEIVDSGRPQTTFARRNRRFLLRYRAAWLVASVSLALFLAMAWPAFMGQVYVADDLGSFHLPLRAFYAAQLSEGASFDWCPNLFCGFYLTGEGQAGTYHPVHLLLYSWFSLATAFNLECLLSYPLILAGVYVLLRRWSVKPEAALFGGMVFAFGGFNLLHFVHSNAVAVVAHLPWVLTALDIWMKSADARVRRYAMVAISILTGSQLLLGYPQYVMFSWFVEIGYLLALCGYLQFGLVKTVQIVVIWSAMISLGILLAGVQLLPTFDALTHSVRRANADSLATYGSLHPVNLFQLVAPYLFVNRVAGQNTHELGIYIGAVPLVLALVACLSLRRNCLRPLNKQLVVIAAVMAGMSLIWVAGSFGPLGWLQDHLPLVNRFRFPARGIVVFQLGVAVLAAVGFGISRKGGHLPRGIWTLGIASVLLPIVGKILWPESIAPWPQVVAGPILVLGAVTLAYLAFGRKRWALAGLVILAAVDLGFYGLSYSVFGRTKELDKFVAQLDTPPGAPSGRVAVDLAAGSEIAPGEIRVRQGDQITLAGWKQVDGYVGLEPSRLLDYRQPAALRAASVAWISQLAIENSATLRRQFGSPDARWVELDSPVRRAWCVSEVIASENPATDISRINLSRQALVEKPALDESKSPASTNALSTGKATVVVDRPGRIELFVECPEEQWLVVSESFHPGWKATIDGDVAKLHRMNGDFMGVRVPAGRHQAGLNFSPESLLWGRIMSCCGLGLIGVFLWWPRRRTTHRDYAICR